MKMYCFWISCLIAVSLVFNDIYAQSGAWTKKANLPKGGGSASVVNGKIYVIGGTKLPQILDLADNEVYDPTNNTWTDKKPMPTARGFLATAVVNDTIYAIGGGYPNSKKNVEAYDPSSDTWTAKANLLENRLGADAGVVNGIIYYIGGNYTWRNCEAYDPSTNQWTKKTDMPGGGGVVSVTAYNGLIYVFGGGYYDCYSNVYAYDPQADTWATKKDMPTKRFAFETFLVDGKIYALGGVQNEFSASIATLEVYDPVNDVWESKSNMPINLAWFTGSVVNNKIYVIGGTTNWTGDQRYEVWEYDPSFHTDIAAGNVSGTWTLAKSPYYINGEITIPNDSTLTIEPGVEVIFMGHYKFNVQGRLLAVGTKTDTIRFTADNKQTGWHGIRFINTPSTNDTSKIICCTFKYGKANTGTIDGLDRCGGAIMINSFDKVFISNCLFESNMTSGDVSSTGGPGVCAFYASPTITKCKFINNDGTYGSAGAIKVDFTSHAVISNNIISNNSSNCGAVLFAYGNDNKPTLSGNIISNNTASAGGGGVFVYGGSMPRLENNIIIHNQAPLGGGIYCLTNASPVIVHNTIVYNNAVSGGGINCNGNCDPTLINNIIYENSANNGNQVYIADAISDPVFKYNDVQGGKEGFVGPGAGSNYTVSYDNNIDSDPLFVQKEKDNFHLSNSSPCIGAGTTESCPVCDIEGNCRPNPSGTNPDIGAYEHELNSPTETENELSTPKEFGLYQNYPNPFNPTTAISYQLPAFSHVTLKIYDVLGREVETLVNEEKHAGNYEVTWNAKGLASGVYFYQLKATPKNKNQEDNFIQTKKLILMK